MAGCKKKHSKQQIANFKQYAISERCGLNRLRRAERTAKHQPNNLQIQETIEKGNTGYTRKKPKISILTNAIKSRLALIKWFTGSGNKALISDNPPTHIKAWRSLLAEKIEALPKNMNKQKRKYGIMTIGGNLPEVTLQALESIKFNNRLTVTKA